jgi:hypothetical protein
MNRRSVLLTLGCCLIAPVSLLASHPHHPSKAPAAKRGCDKCGPKCRGCGPRCKGKCDRRCKCRCNSKCGTAPNMRHSGSRHHSGPHHEHSHDRGNSQARPHGPSRGRGYSPQHHSRSSSGFSSIISKFDKNRDGKLDEKERAEARKYFVSRHRR